jgi:nonsense-mediated mRNA decay protein 3
MVPHKNKISKELVSHDTKNNTYNYKYTFYVEIPKINKDDIIVLPKKL